MMSRRKWPLMATLLVVVTGMAFSLLWAPVVTGDVAKYKKHPIFKTALVKHLSHLPPIPHQWYWIAPGDIWGTFRAAQTIGWGWLGGIYSAHGGFLLPPGILFMLQPVAKIARLLHLTESFPFPLIRPTAWLVLGPYEMALSGVALFGLDALAERLGIPARRRAWLCLAEAVALWQVVVMWGHPEDVVALGLACYAIRAAMDHRPVATGWLAGAALGFQPLVVLTIPVILAISITRAGIARAGIATNAESTAAASMAGTVSATSAASAAEDNTGAASPNMTSGTTSNTTSGMTFNMPSGMTLGMIWSYIKQMFSILWRAAAVPAVLVATPLISQPRDTWRALAVQPTYPKVDHPTPWLALAPKLGNGAVSGGPTRLFAVAVACVIGYVLFVMARRGMDVERLIPAACAVSFLAWCFFESVMTPYYVWPALAFALLAATMLSYPRLIGTLFASMFATVFAFQHAGPWLYWGVVTASLAAACAIGIPRQFHQSLAATQPLEDGSSQANAEPISPAS